MGFCFISAPFSIWARPGDYLLCTDEETQDPERVRGWPKATRLGGTNSNQGTEAQQLMISSNQDPSEAQRAHTGLDHREQAALVTLHKEE